ncbi:aminotransferase class V-fold PLP-dependent enzyme [Alienimonas sp. DA493]|uniref:aminotransferase class V-fold PLP-dependent enzyme n=1 Tax=Alienimonas sp. DA493 TaxID=3373605 RepID=UPI0037549C4F
MTDDAFAALRTQMPVTERYAYFDHAAVGPLPAPAAAAMAEYAADFRDHGDVHWPKWRAQTERCRDRFAELLNAAEGEIAVVRNTTEGIGLVAEGIDWREGDNVVVPASEFPSNLLPWRNLQSRGVQVREVEALDERLDPAKVRDACDGRTRVVAASWVGYATGWRNDPADLCQIAHDAGAFFLLDAIQGLGVLPLDVREVPIDFLCADGHKWLLGPEGAGVLYVREDRRNDLRPLLVGWNSVSTAGAFGSKDLTLKDAAERYEGGTYAAACVAGLAASLDLLAPIPPARRGERLLALTDRLVDGLTEAACTVASNHRYDRRSGIVAFTPPDGDSAGCEKRLLAEGIVVRVRHDRVRAAPHLYTSEAEVDRLIAAVS